MIELIPFVITKQFKNRISYGYLWIFSNEVKTKDENSKKVAMAEVYDTKGNFLCKGVCNPKSLIFIRVLSFNTNDIINKDFFKKRIINAFEYRKKLAMDINFCRLVYGESDFLPGVVIDRYGNTFVVQFYSYAMEILFKKYIIEGIVDIFNPEYILVRNDFYQRELEGTQQYKEICYTKKSKNVNELKVYIQHLSMKLVVDILNGQKTGFYYDQLDNRKYFSTIVKDKKVLDLCCYTGSFGILASLKGAKSVVCVDSSQYAIELAKENAKLNKVNNIDFVCVEAEEFIKNTKDKYDVIIFDPPSYTRSNKDVKNAIKKYISMCSNIIKILNNYGIFCFSVCSRHIKLEDVQKVLVQSLTNCQRRGYILYCGTQSLDHPVYLPMKDETEYLKFVSILVI